MSEKPKNLRKYISKAKNQPKETDEQQNEIVSRKENVENNKDQEQNIDDIDPLKFFEQPKEQPIIPQISFLDLINNRLEEKIEEEKTKEQENSNNQKEADDDELDQRISIIARVQSKKKKPEENKVEKEPEKENEPPKLLGSLNKKIDENELLKQLEKLNEELKDEPHDLPELDENKKKRLMARMTSAKQGVNKLTLGKALLQRATGLLEKQGKYDDQLESLKQVHQLVTTDLKNTFVLNDPDVQRINENESGKVLLPVKTVNIEALMKAKNAGGEKKEKKNLKDIILGKKKQQQPSQPEQPK